MKTSPRRAAGVGRTMVGWVLGGLLLVSAAPHSWAAATSLDYDVVKRAYSDGDFEKVIAHCERGLKTASASHEDSLYAARYLGIVYAANPATRERGRFWFGRLLRDNPKASITDLIVSDDVDAAFIKVRDEVWSEMALTESNGERSNTHSALHAPVRNTPSQAVAQKQSHGGLWLLLGSVTVVGVVTTYFLTSQSHPAAEREIRW
jgi:hypothetical protein